MSVHKSLRLGSGLVRSRSVLSRAERVLQLQKEGRLRPGDRILGLPKVKVEKAVKKTKGKKKEEKEAAPAAGAAPAAPVAAPAAAAKKPSK